MLPKISVFFMADEYMAMKDIDGALVGGASLTLDSYKGLIEGLVK